MSLILYVPNRLSFRRLEFSLLNGLGLRKILVEQFLRYPSIYKETHNKAWAAIPDSQISETIINLSLHAARSRQMSE